MTRRGSVLTAAAAAVLVLAACDPSIPEPNYSSVSPTPSTSTSAAPTSSPSPSVPASGPNSSPGEVAPTLPADAALATQVGAQSFAAYYFKMLDWSYAVNRADLMDPLFATDCDNCAKLATNLSDTFSRGTVTGTRVFIKQIALVSNDGRRGAQYAVDGVLDITAGALTESGTSTAIPAESNVTVTLWLIDGPNGFHVVSQAKA